VDNKSLTLAKSFLLNLALGISLYILISTLAIVHALATFDDRRTEQARRRYH
jgi:hypothetical protein